MNILAIVLILLLPGIHTNEQAVLATARNDNLARIAGPRTLGVLLGKTARNDIKQGVIADAEAAGFSALNVRILKNLNRNILLFGEGYSNSQMSKLKADQEVLISFEPSKNLSDSVFLEICQRLPVRNKEFESGKFNFLDAIGGSTSVTNFHTMVSNRQQFCNYISRLYLNLDSDDSCDVGAVSILKDSELGVEHILVLAYFSDSRIKDDEDLKNSLTGRGAKFGENFAYFIFTEPDIPPQSTSDCLKYLKAFVDSHVN